MVKEVKGPLNSYSPSFSTTRPNSRTILVSSSANSGTPSVLTIICSMISSGRGWPPATRWTMEAQSDFPNRFRITVPTWE